MSDREFEDLESEVKTLSGRRDEAFAVYEPLLKEWCAAYHKLSQAKERRVLLAEVRAFVLKEQQNANVVAEPSAEETND